MRFPQFGKLGILAALRAAERRAAEHEAMIAALQAENDALRSELSSLRDALRHEVMRLSPVMASVAQRSPAADDE
jgi:hypothetical protein